MKLKCLLGKHEYIDAHEGGVYLDSYINDDLDILYDRFMVNLICKHCGKRKTGTVTLPRSLSTEMGWFKK